MLPHVPKFLNLSHEAQKPPAIAATSILFDAQPSNGSTFAPSSKIIIPLPTARPGSFLDPFNSYLSFNLMLTRIIAYNFNEDKIPISLPKCGAMGVIKSFRLLVNSIPVEEILNYNLLAEFLVGLNGHSGHPYMDKHMFLGAIEQPRLNNMMIQSVLLSNEDNVANDNQVSHLELRNTRVCHKISFNDAYMPYPTIGGVDTVAAQADLDSYQALGYMNSSPIGVDASTRSIIRSESDLFAMGMKQGRFRPTLLNPDFYPRLGFNLNNTVSYQVCFPLISTWIGMMAEKAFPLLLLSPQSLQIELELENSIKWATQCQSLAVPAYLNVAAVAEVNLPVATYTVDTVRFVGQEILVGDEVAIQVMSAAQNPAIGLSMHGQTWRNYQSFIPSGVASANFIIPIKVLSANSIFFLFRPQWDSGLYSAYNLSTIQPGDLLKYGSAQLLIGTQRMPQRPLKGRGQFMAEFKKAWNSLLDTDVHFTSNFAHGFDDVVTSADGVYALGFNMDTFSIANDAVRSGYNTIGDQMNLELNSNTATPLFTPASGGAQVDAFVHHDIKLTFLAGGVVTVIW